MGVLGPFELDTIVVGDCLDVMRQMPDGCVDAVITDPPYNIGLDYGPTCNDNNQTYMDWTKRWFAEVQRICSGAVCVSCGQVNIDKWWASMPAPKWLLCWWKPAAMGRSPVGFCNWEPMLLYGTSKSRKGCDVVRAPIKPDRELDGHPCPKPLEWGVGFINLLSNPGDVVFDPFMGSGTTAVAAKKLGRHYFGCDISAEYVELARERVARVDGVQLELSQSIASYLPASDSSYFPGFDELEGDSQGERRAIPIPYAVEA